MEEAYLIPCVMEFKEFLSSKCSDKGVVRQLADMSDIYVKFVNILIDVKCLVSIKCLTFAKSVPSTKRLTSAKSLAFAKICQLLND